MPSIYQAHVVHTTYYLKLVEQADEYYSKNHMHDVGISLLDQNREQVDAALEWLIKHNPTKEIDVLVFRFSDALSAIGIIRYSATEKLLPLQRKAVIAAQNLEYKDLEASSLDGLGILYAFLGYLTEASSIFETAYSIAEKIDNRQLKQEIRQHLNLARKQMRGDKRLAMLQWFRIIQLIHLQLRLWFEMIKRNSFVQVTFLNQIGNICLDLNLKKKSIQYFQRALSLSQSHAYRFGELEASMGLLQTELADYHAGVSVKSGASVGNLINGIGFRWSTDYLVLDTLLEISPVIRNAEILATRLANLNDPQANKVFQMLDCIIAHTKEIVLTATQNSDQKHEIFLVKLSQIRDDLSVITKISSEINRK